MATTPIDLAALRIQGVRAELANPFGDISNAALHRAVDDLARVVQLLVERERQREREPRS